MTAIETTIQTSLHGLRLGLTKDDHLVQNGRLMAPSARTPKARFELFDDFLYQTLTEADTPWILNNGTDTTGTDAVVSADECGKLVLTSGDAGSGLAADGCQAVGSIPVQADSGGLVFETRLHINSAIANAVVLAGLTDSTSLEATAAVGGSDAITTTLSNGCLFIYDVGADTDEWFAVGVDGDTDATGNGTTGTAPVADTYQTLRIEIDADGEGAKFFIDGDLVKTLTAAATSATTNLYPFVMVGTATTAQKSIDVDYILVQHDR